MNRLTLFILQIFLVAVTTLTASHWKSSTQTAGAAQAQTASAGKAAEGANTLGADQANKASNTGVAVPETPTDVTARPGLAASAPGTALTPSSGIVGDAENTLGADQANRASNTGVDVPETPTDIIARPGLAAGPGLAASAGTALIDPEGADPRSERNFSFDTEKDPTAVSSPQN